MPDEYSHLTVELACKMRQAFYDNSSTKWKQSILAMLKQTPIRFPVGAPNGASMQKARYQMYVTLAQTAALTGDAVETENCYQHAEHYYRVMKERTG